MELLLQIRNIFRGVRSFERWQWWWNVSFRRIQKWKCFGNVRICTSNFWIWIYIKRYDYILVNKHSGIGELIDQILRFHRPRQKCGASVISCAFLVSMATGLHLQYLMKNVNHVNMPITRESKWKLISKISIRPRWLLSPRINVIELYLIHFSTCTHYIKILLWKTNKNCNCKIPNFKELKIQ